LQELKVSPEALAIHDSINATAAPYPDCSIKTLFEQCAERRATAACVVDQDEVLSYREINQLANGLAARLRRLGVSSGDTVGISIKRSPELIIALLAITKCGAAYLPFDATWPDQLLTGIFSDTHCQLLLIRDVPGLADRFPQYRVEAVLRDELDPVEENPALDVAGDAIAYINFTSGTTGRSKGVQIQHRSISRLITSPSYATLDDHSVVLHMSPVTFDAATFEIWGPLLNGGTCALYPPGMPRFSELSRVIGRRGINCVFLTTALFNAVVDEAPDALKSVETILFGGEIYSDRHVRQALNSYGGDRLVHVYGPTECTTFATFFPVDRMPAPGAELPIGRPIQNTVLYVISDGCLCRAGEVGEVLLGGPGLSPGYLESGSVRGDGFGEFDIDGTCQRLYRTGDYGYLLDSGDLVFQGRSDDQVKVDGFRIELSVVSRALGEHPNVSRCYVTVAGDTAGEKILLAFVVPRSENFDPRQTREDLKSHLPAYMVPKVIHACDKLPLLPTGKVDRRALLALHDDLYARSVRNSER
jgi:D-alanine--poly(phosphoribitol) ligase subunit 1